MPKIVHYLWEDSSWQDQARCATTRTDPEFFFIDGRGDSRALMHAKQFCSPCPVRLQCALLGFAVGGADIVFYGVFGGLSASDRYRIKRWSRQLGVEISEMLPFIEDEWDKTDSGRSRAHARPRPRANTEPA